MALGLLPVVIGALGGIIYSIVQNERVQHEWRKEYKLAVEEGRRPPRPPVCR